MLVLNRLVKMIGYILGYNKSSWLKFLFVTLLVLLSILFVFCLIYKIVVSCIIQCVTQPLTIIIMANPLEMVDQLYSSI